MNLQAKSFIEDLCGDLKELEKLPHKEKCRRLMPAMLSVTQGESDILFNALVNTLIAKGVVTEAELIDAKIEEFKTPAGKFVLAFQSAIEEILGYKIFDDEELGYEN